MPPLLARRSRPALILSASLAIFAAACGSAVSPAPAGSAARSAAPSITAVPGAPSRSPAPTAPSTTNTEFGRIWDALPPSWPALAGALPANDSSLASGLFAFVQGDAAASSATMRGLLERRGWTVDVGTPLEDGTVVLEAVGADPSCKAEVRFTPVSGSLIMEVLYGADCPFS